MPHERISPQHDRRNTKMKKTKETFDTAHTRSLPDAGLQRSPPAIDVLLPVFSRWMVMNYYRR